MLKNRDLVLFASLRFAHLKFINKKHMRKILIVMLSMLLLNLQLLAQNRTVTGKVTDAAGAPVAGASVQVKKTSVGTVTQTDGTFTISIPANGKVLVFSGADVTAQEITVGTSTAINVTLQSADKSLQEVVVTGYQTRRKREEGGAISSVKGKDIQNLPNISVDRALQGRAAGVLVQANNGIPGGAINVRIRGTGSFIAGTQPLYIVDGVQFNNRVDGGFTQNNPLAFLNPNDIESIDVLKDAASAAIYGAQASNGVVIITTKKGRPGATRFNINLMNGYTDPLKKFDVLTSQEYVNARAEADFNRFSPQSRSTGAAYPFLESQRWALGELSSATGASYNGVTSLFNQKQVDSMIAALPNYDWQSAALQQGSIRNVDIAMSGGNEKTTFYVAGNYTKQSTIFKKVDFERFGLNLDLTNKINSKLTLLTKLNLSTYEQKIPFSTDGSSLGSPAFSSPIILPVNKIRNSDGTYFGLPPSQALAGILNQNIVAVNEFNSGFQRTNQIIGSGALDYKIASWLSYRGFVSLDYRLVQGKSYRDPRTNDGIGVRGRGTVQSNWNTNVLTTQTLQFNTHVGENLKIDGIVGYEFRRDINEGISAAGIGFPSPDFLTINAAATPESVGEFYTGFKRTGVLGRVNLNWRSKYILSVLARRDGSSRFGANNRFGNFGGIIGTWNVDDESFLRDVSWLSQLRLRASFGQTGNDQIGNFDALSLYSAGAQYGGAAGINYGGLPNPNLKWERNQTLNLGIDYGFFQNRVSGSLEVFNRKTKDALLTKPVPWLNGTGAYTENIGQIDIKGIESAITVEIIRPRNPSGLKWNANFNFTFLYNKVGQLYGGAEVLPGDPSVRVGRSIGSVFTQQYMGVNVATGRPMFKDTFNNITYSPQNRDRRYIGDTEPDYFGGLGSTFSYNGFTLDVLFSYEFGRLATDGQVNFMLENGNRTFNTLRSVYENRWLKPGDVTAVPRIYDTGVEPGGVNHISGSSRLWRKADFIRMRDVRISYNFATSLLKNLKVSNAMLYVQGQNLFTSTDWLGYDPEFVGTTTGIIPQTKNINIGLQIGF